MCRIRIIFRCILWGILTLLFTTPALSQVETVVQLSNGMVLGPGILSETDSITSTSFQQGGNSSGSKPIGVMIEGIRKTYFNDSPINVLHANDSNAPPLVQIELPAAREVARSGNPPVILQVLGVSAFSKYGRRTFSMLTPKGRVDVLQGITLLTPKFAQLEVLHTQTAKFVWDSRIATASIPPNELRAILEQELDLSNSGDWLRMISFYMEAERYSEAREILSSALQRFRTELADQAALIGRLDQLYANQKFEELELRRNAGQSELAATVMGEFPIQTLSIASQSQLQTELENLQERLQLIGELSNALKTRVAQLPEPDQQAVAPVIDELFAEVSLETIDRLVDFNLLRSNDSIPNENKVALAISGWLLGMNNGIDNFAVVKSLLRVRGMVNEYLNDAPQPRRQQIISQLAGEEGAQPAILAKLLATMKPPQSPPPVKEADPPGLHRLSITNGFGGTTNYLVQVPPEYDPNRKYPCIFALPGTGNAPELEINAWCGVYAKLAYGMARSGQATRRGYIVVSPDWMEEKQTSYQYTEQEHDRILACLRDAYRKFSIDTDRVFVTGHFDGATAAWDLAVAHPDLWAGAIMISPGADKFIVHYSLNVEGPTNDQRPLGTYIVYGDSDGRRLTTKLGSVATGYLKTATFDNITVEYRGRGSGLFQEEMPRIFEWMELSSHRRVRTPRTIQAKTMRSGDRFFYWLEAPSITPEVAGNAYAIDPSAAGSFEANRLDASNNGVRVSKIPSPGKAASIWLTPDMVDFSRPITVSVAGRKRNFDPAPSVAVMLEDARGRGDRMHVFWQEIKLQ